MNLQEESLSDKMFDAMMDMPFGNLEDFNIAEAADVCEAIAEAHAEQERIKYALEILKEVNLPYADNELLWRRVKNKINYLQKQLK